MIFEKEVANIKTVRTNSQIDGLVALRKRIRAQHAADGKEDTKRADQISGGVGKRIECDLCSAKMSTRGLLVDIPLFYYIMQIISTKNYNLFPLIV